MVAKRRSLGKLLRQLREEHEIGIKKLAPELGVNYTYLSKLENNKARPSDQLIERIANYFNCDRDMLYVAADKVPHDAMEVIRRYPRESLQYLRSLAQHASKRSR